MKEFKEYYIENTERVADRHFHCHEQRMQPYTAIAPHIHTWVELLYCTEGHLRVFLASSVVDFTAGSLVLIPASQVHFVESVHPAASRYIVIKFSPEFLFSIIDEFDYDCLLPFLLKGSAADCLCKSDLLQSRNIGGLVEEMLREYNEKAYGYRLALRADACKLILFLLRFPFHRIEARTVAEAADRQDRGEGAAKGGVAVRRVFDVIVYIQKHYSQPITLEDMAALCHVSYSYFSRQFAAITGQSFASFLCSVRLSAAEHLLITTDIPITEVAFQVGFSDASYFTRRFSSKNGMTPGAYRGRYSVASGGLAEE